MVQFFRSLENDHVIVIVGISPDQILPDLSVPGEVSTSYVIAAGIMKNQINQSIESVC